MNIAQRLKELMDKNNLSNSKLAKEIGVHTSSVSRWLDGKPITGDNLSKVCAYFSVSVDYLIGATNVINDAGSKKSPSKSGEGYHAIDYVDDELKEYLDELRNRPEMRMLFSTTKHATKAQIYTRFTHGLHTAISLKVPKAF